LPTVPRLQFGTVTVSLKACNVDNRVRCDCEYGRRIWVNW